MFAICNRHDRKQSKIKEVAAEIPLDTVTKTKTFNAFHSVKPTVQVEKGVLQILFTKPLIAYENESLETVN